MRLRDLWYRKGRVVSADQAGRLLLIIEGAVVGVLYIVSVWRIRRGLKAHPNAASVWRRNARGRLLRCLALPMFCIALIQGQIDLWNQPLATRVFWVQAGLVFAFFGWLYVHTSVPDNDLLNAVDPHTGDADPSHPSSDRRNPGARPDRRQQRR